MISLEAQTLTSFQQQIGKFLDDFFELGVPKPPYEKLTIYAASAHTKLENSSTFSVLCSLRSFAAIEISSI